MASFEMTTTIESAYAKETATTSCPTPCVAGTHIPGSRRRLAPPPGTRGPQISAPGASLGLSFTATADARAAGRERAEQELEARRGEREREARQGRSKGRKGSKAQEVAAAVRTPSPITPPDTALRRFVVAARLPARWTW